MILPLMPKRRILLTNARIGKTPLGVLGPKDHAVNTGFATNVRELAKTPLGVLGPKDHAVNTDLLQKCANWQKHRWESSGLKTMP